MWSTHIGAAAAGDAGTSSQGLAHSHNSAEDLNCCRRASVADSKMSPMPESDESDSSSSKTRPLSCNTVLSRLSRMLALRCFPTCMRVYVHVYIIYIYIDIINGYYTIYDLI